MNKKKKKNPAADDLFESLMQDIEGAKSDTSHKISKEDEDHFFSEDPSAASGIEDADGLSEKTNVTSGSLWGDLKQGLSSSSKTKSGFDPFTDSHSSATSPLSGAAGLLQPHPEEKFVQDPLMAKTGTHIPSHTSSRLDLQAEGLENLFPTADEGPYKGPSLAGDVYQSPDEVFGLPSAPNTERPSETPPVADESTRPVYGEEKTVSLQNEPPHTKSAIVSDNERTLAVEGFAQAKLGARRKVEPDVKVSIGQLRGSSGLRTGGGVFTSMDASLVQAENLKLAQQRILELEKETEKLRAENEELASAGDIVRVRADEYAIKLTAMEKEKAEIEESHQSEVLILKGNLQYKESEVTRARMKVDELDTRLKADFKKIRVKERELENRLELMRAEKAALIRSKDEYILEMKRKIDQLQSELDNYRGKVLELNKTVESNQEQFKRTVRALRLALSNLEVKEENLVPFKKAD